MKLRALKHGRGDVASSWPPSFSGSYKAGDTFPVGEMGKLTKVEASKLTRGVVVHIEHEGRSLSGVMEWNGEKPSVEKVVEVLNRHVGKDIKGLGNIELD